MRMHFRKLLIIISAIAICLSISACGSSKQESLDENAITLTPENFSEYLAVTITFSRIDDDTAKMLINIEPLKSGKFENVNIIINRVLSYCIEGRDNELALVESDPSYKYVKSIESTHSATSSTKWNAAFVTVIDLPEDGNYTEVHTVTGEFYISKNDVFKVIGPLKELAPDGVVRSVYNQDGYFTDGQTTITGTFIPY